MSGPSNPAALKPRGAEIIGAGIAVERGTAEQQKRYNDIAHVPSNYDLGRTPTETQLGDITSVPEAIIVPDFPMP